MFGVMRGCVGSWVALVLACGPSVASEDGGADGSGDSGGTSSGVGSATASTSAGSTGADTGSTMPGTTSSDDGSVDTGVVSFDVGAIETGDPPPEPPRGCDRPDNPNADVSGTTPAGERTYTAAVFAEGGGGKCPQVFEVALAADPAALAAGLAVFVNGGFPGELAVDLVIPAEGVSPGEWEASVRLADVPDEPAPASANVMIVPDFHSPAPLLQIEITTLDPAWDLGGMITAHYCDVIATGACGA